MEGAAAVATYRNWIRIGAVATVGSAGALALLHKHPSKGRVTPAEVGGYSLAIGTGALGVAGGIAAWSNFTVGPLPEMVSYGLAGPRLNGFGVGAWRVVGAAAGVGLLAGGGYLAFQAAKELGDHLRDR